MLAGAEVSGLQVMMLCFFSSLDINQEATASRSHAAVLMNQFPTLPPSTSFHTSTQAYWQVLIQWIVKQSDGAETHAVA